MSAPPWIALALLSAVAWRLRGGPISYLVPGITSPLSRVFYALCVAMFIGIIDWEWTTSVIVFIQAWSMLTLISWGDYQQMGGNTDPDDNGSARLALQEFGLVRTSWEYDAVGMAVCGWVMASIAALFDCTFIVIDYLAHQGQAQWISWLGIAMMLPFGAVAQVLGYSIASMFKNWKRWNKFIDGYTAIGEFLVGAAWGPILAMPFWLK